MATSGSETFVKGGNEEYFEWRCGLCEDEKGIMKEAVAYCKNCAECLCVTCLQPHNRYNKNHKVLGTNEKQDWGKKEEVIQDTGIECPEHPGETIKMYCGHHGELCCSVCAAMKHDCKTAMIYIPQAAKAIKDCQEFKDVLQSLDSHIFRFSNQETQDNQFQTTLDTELKEQVKEIEKFYKELQERIDQSKKASISEITTVYKDMDRSVKASLQTSEKARKTLQDVKKKLQPTGTVNESLLFVEMKNATKVISEAEKQPVASYTQDIPRFERGRALEEAVKSVATLGDFLTKRTSMADEKTPCDASKNKERLGNAAAGQTVTEATDSPVTPATGQLPTELASWPYPTHGRELEEMLYVGARVQRGTDWDKRELTQLGNENEDQPGGEGTITHLPPDVASGTATVRWDNGITVNYCMGFWHMYELMLVPGSYNPPS